MSNTRLAQRIAHNIDPKWPKPTKFFGGGVNGRVYKTNNGRLMKFIYDYAPQEYESLQKLQGTFIVPRFKKGNGHILNLNENLSKELRNDMFPNAQNNSNSLTVFIMGRVGNSSSTTLRNYISKHPSANKKNIARRVAYLVKEMHLRGVSHGNLHDANIIVSADSAGRITGMWAIDFGRSRSIPRGKTETKMYKGEKPNIHFPTQSLYGKVTRLPVYNGSRANINMLHAVTTAKMPKSTMSRIARRRSEVASIMKQYKSPSRAATRPSPRRTKSLSPRRTSASPARPRSAPARASVTRSRTLKSAPRRSLRIKRKRA